VVRSYQLELPRGLAKDEHFRALAATVQRAVASGFVPGGQYSALLVDEAHDFEDAWLRLAVQLVNPVHNSLLVLYDDAQSIYQMKRRRFSFAGVGIEARGRTSILKLNYRNTAEVLALALHCAQGLLQGAGAARGEDEVPLVQPASAGRRGKLPVLIEAASEADEAALVAERVAGAVAAGRAPGEIVVLCRSRPQMKPFERALAARGIAHDAMRAEGFRRFDWGAPHVRLLTLHSAKGLEFPLVFVTGLQSMPMGRETHEEAVRLLYVAMTRATHELILSASGSGAMVQRVRVALAEVARGFAAAGG
jgi:superfamily I DNA/RNA helicase